MILFVCALAAEARAVIDYYGLNKVQGPITCYESDSVALAVSGMGKSASAISTSHLLTKFPQARMIINLGIAGCHQEKIAIGEALLVNKISDMSLQKDYYPDILFSHDFLEADLCTYDMPQGKESEAACQLVDMEGSGFFEAARVFVKLHQIVIIKIVSDHLDTSIPEKEQVARWITEWMEKIDTALQNALKGFETKVVLESDEILLLEQIGTNLNLTRSQQEKLWNLACFCKLQNRSLESLEMFTNKQSTDKRMREKVFEQIKEKLVC